MVSYFSIGQSEDENDPGYMVPTTVFRVRVEGYVRYYERWDGRAWQPSVLARGLSGMGGDPIFMPITEQQAVSLGVIINDGSKP